MKTGPHRILWISCVAEKGGAEVYMLNLLRHLPRDRFVPAVALLRPGPLTEDLQEAGIRTFVMREHRMRNGFALLRSIRQIARIIDEEQIHLVHSNGFRAHAYGGPAARTARVPEIWSVHTVETPGWITRAILAIPSTQLLANSPRTADYFITRHCATSLIWPSIDLCRLTRQTPRAELAKRHRIPENAVWLVMAARMQRYKGHPYFLKTLASLRRKGITAEGIVIGGALFGMEPDYPRALRQMACALNLGAHVHFPGFVSEPDLHGFIAAAQVVVHPALEEDFGLIVAEAQALAKPVVAFDAPGPSAIIAPETTGRLVPTGDQEALDRSLMDLINDPARCAAWGEAARDRAVRFSAESTAQHLEHVYSFHLGADRRRFVE